MKTKDKLKKQMVKIVNDVLYSEFPILNLSQKKITYLDTDELQALSEILEQCKFIEKINFSNIGLGNLFTGRLNILLSFLPKLPNLKFIDLSCNNLVRFNNSRLRILSHFLAQCASLEEIILTDNMLGNLEENGFSIFFKLLFNCPRLSYIFLGNNNLNLGQIESLYHIAWLKNCYVNNSHVTTKTLLMCFERFYKNTIPPELANIALEYTDHVTKNNISGELNFRYNYLRSIIY